MLSFHANIYALPEHAAPSEPLSLRGESLAPLRDGQGRPPIFETFLPVTFEAAYDALIKLPRLDAEPDGFLVIAGDAEGRRWQLDGHLFDFGDRLHRLQLHGECPADALDDILRCLGWPDARLAFEVITDGVVFDEPTFRRYAASA
ncbi:MAG: hypothetical protein KDA44_05895 [Planctomycetales bacterium]|nr:hypothetical protein [Planctomycetales bacterium]